MSQDANRDAIREAYAWAVLDLAIHLVQAEAALPDEIVSHERAIDALSLLSAIPIDKLRQLASDYIADVRRAADGSGQDVVAVNVLRLFQ